ncbi:MAG: family oxidoreductase [Actinomycetota bacterium]|nr:family oxidoreductase [Actinomycetota bacterium]
MRIAVTGSTGLIGTALVSQLHAAGHDVVRLVRRPPRAADEISWDPSNGSVDVGQLQGVEGAVNLAGAGIGDRRWTSSYQELLVSSRVDSTRTLAEALASLDPLPRVLVSGSAVGFYGDRGDEVLTEDASPGRGFLADLTQAWEAAASPATDAGIRVVTARTGIVLSPDGGALARMLPLARLGLGGPLGSGDQWWPWITLADEVRALEFLLDQDLTGPVNLTAPQPVRNAAVAAALGTALNRPALLRAPAFALRALLGQFADDMLASQRVLPSRLLDAGFGFGQRTIEQAASWALRR